MGLTVLQGTQGVSLGPGLHNPVPNVMQQAHLCEPMHSVKSWTWLYPRTSPPTPSCFTGLLLPLPLTGMGAEAPPHVSQAAPFCLLQCSGVGEFFLSHEHLCKKTIESMACFVPPVPTVVGPPEGAAPCGKARKWSGFCFNRSAPPVRQSLRYLVLQAAQRMRAGIQPMQSFLLTALRSESANLYCD